MNEDFRPFTVTEDLEGCATCDQAFKIGDVVLRGFGNDLVCNDETCTARYEKAYAEHMSQPDMESLAREIFGDYKS